MIELSEAQSQALAVTPEPCQVIDPRTKRTYVLLGVEAYEQMKALLEDGLDMRQVGALVNENMREYDEGDPLLEGYQVPRP
jgi:hypothetical protein